MPFTEASAWRWRQFSLKWPPISRATCALLAGNRWRRPGACRCLRVCAMRGTTFPLETSGARSVREVDSRVARGIARKPPGSGEVNRNLWENMESLSARDQVKFVICDRADYEWARFKLDQCALAERAGEVLFSPSYGQLNPGELADWILADNLPVRFQIQLHKSLWGDKPGH